MSNDWWTTMVSFIPFKIQQVSTVQKSFITEEYVKYCLNTRKRSLTAQIRIGILPLCIETGRFRNLKVEERVSQVCNNGDVEYKFHFVCICNAYTTWRNAGVW